MPSRKKVQNTHIGTQLRALHGSLLDIMSAMNRPQRDEVLIKEAAIPLDRALFPLLVGIERFGLQATPLLEQQLLRNAL